MIDPISALKAKAIPPLDADEEKDLLAYARQGSAAAREALIHSQIPLVINLARASASVEDSVQAGMVGLMAAVDKFDGRGRLSTYAYTSIHGAICEQARSALRSVYVPTDVARKNNNAVRIGEQDRVAQTVSLDAAEYDTNADPHPGPDEQAAACDTAENLRAGLSKLRPRTAQMISMYYGIDGEPQTFREIGERFGITGSAAHLAIQEGLKRLRKLVDPAQRAWRHPRS